MIDNETTTSMAIDDIHLLVATLPAALQAALNGMKLEELVEVVMDLGRPAEARFPGCVVPLSTHPLNHDDIAHTLALVGDFTADNRAGIERTLHRISAIRNRKGKIIGMTIRVGRAVYGTIEILRDLIETGDNLLFVGRPGVGKTTKLREVARVLADEMHKRVIVIDTSNEIAGDGDIPHPGIGSARRMQVPRPDRQHAVMIEAVENHMPEVIIVDEIGTEAEAAAARTIAERGVQLIGTAHGNSLENLIMNPTLSDLVGGVQTVTLGDEEARRRGTTKTVNERKAPPTFEILIEMASRDEVCIHRDTAKAVDTILRGLLPHCERRILAADGHIEVKDHQPIRNMQKKKNSASPELLLSPELPPSQGPPRLYLRGVKKDLTERAARELGLSIRLVVKPQRADIIIALRTRGKNQGLEQISKISDAPVHRIKRNTTSEIRRMLQRVFNIVPGVEDKEIQKTLQETTFAIEQVIEEGVEVALPPRRSALRKIQHRLITDRGLESTSIGCEPQRHLVVYPFRD